MSLKKVSQVSFRNVILNLCFGSVCFSTFVSAVCFLTFVFAVCLFQLLLRHDCLQLWCGILCLQVVFRTVLFNVFRLQRFTSQICITEIGVLVFRSRC